MNDYIVTGFDLNYFNVFGISWLASLREIGNYKGKIIAVLYESFPSYIVDQLHLENVVTFFSKEKKSRISTLDFILDYETEGKLAYWDVDGYFTSSVEEIFSFEEDRLILCENKNPGFFAGKQSSWKEFKKFRELTLFFEFSASTNFADFYPSLVTLVDDEWNYCEPARLLSCPQKTKFVHLTGVIKSFPNKELLFSERYPEIHNEWLEKFSSKSLKKKLIRSVVNP